MMTDAFEAAFDRFLAGQEDAADFLYLTQRAAFLEGWKAAGGEMPPEDRTFAPMESSRPPEDPAT